MSVCVRVCVCVGMAIGVCAEAMAQSQREGRGLAAIVSLLRDPNVLSFPITYFFFW